MHVLRMRPINAPPGTTETVLTEPTREALIKRYHEERVPAYYETSNGRKSMRHHKEKGPLFNYEPINPEAVDNDGAGIHEDYTRAPFSAKEFAEFVKVVDNNPNGQPAIVHRLVATLKAGGLQG